MLISGKSSLVVRVELAEHNLFVSDGHRSKADLLVGHRADGQHGQLRLDGVDHVGHRTGEILLSPAVDLVQNYRHAEYLPGEQLCIKHWPPLSSWMTFLLFELTANLHISTRNVEQNVYQNWIFGELSKESKGGRGHSCFMDKSIKIADVFKMYLQ